MLYDDCVCELMQFKQLLWNGATLFLIQFITIGDDKEDTMAPPYATVLEEFVGVF